MNTQTLNSESRLISSLLKTYANCPDSQPRNKAKNALSLAGPVSLGLATAKIEIFWDVQEKKELFFNKMLAEKENVCIFVAEKS